MPNLRKVANSAVVFSELMEGRDAIKTEDIIKYYPEGITLWAVEPVQMPDKRKKDEIARFYVCIFKEEPKKFYNSGELLTKSIDAMLAEVEGDIEELNREIQADGNLKIVLNTKRTQNGFDVTTVKFI